MYTNNKYLTIFFTAALLSLPVQSKASCVEVQQKFPSGPKADIAQAYQNWINTVTQVKDPQKVEALYSDQAILIPTVENSLHKRVQGNRENPTIKDYFVDFTALKNLNAKTNKINIKLVPDTPVGIASGHYTFSYEDDKSNVIEVPARFTFVFRNEDDTWRILHHHSSAMPQAKK